MNTFQNQMEKSGQRFATLDVWKKNTGLNRIRAELKTTLGPDANSMAQIAGWAQRFKQGDF
jgi:hypothetical protein